jgi:glycerophosphoryl diester phosphodiesterase
MNEPNPLRVGGRPPAAVLNIAHRGARAFAPENTLPAFEKAVSFGCRLYELDVHMSKDRELVVHHDDELWRCTDVAARFPGRGTSFVSDFTFDELCMLDAGSWYVEELALSAAARQPFLRSLTDDEIDRFVSPEDRELYASGKIRIPSLNEALELAGRLGMMVNIELKMLPRMYPGLAAAVVDLVAALGMEQSVLISSFDHEQLVEVRRRSSVIATGVLTSDRLARPGEYLQRIDADAYHPGCYGVFDSLGFGSLIGELDPRGIASVLKFGRAVNVWTCNDPDQMRRLIAVGVTGIMTDFPNRLREVVCEARAGESGGVNTPG